MPEAAEKDPFEHTRMSLAQHLEELRKRLIRGLIALAIAFFVSWEYRAEIAGWILLPLHHAQAWATQYQVEQFEKDLAEHPDKPRTEYFESADPADEHLLKPLDWTPQALGVGENFFFAFRLSFYAALFLGGPVLLWQMWGFIAAGLYQKERRMVMSYFPGSVVLFLAGVAASYFLMVPFGIYFLSQTLPTSLVEFRPRLEDYMDFLSNTCLWAGVTFQLPIVIQVLIRLDFVQAKTFARYRKHFIVVSFLIAGIVTPGTDPYSQVFMAIPMWGLYELGIALGRWSLARSRKAAEATP